MFQENGSLQSLKWRRAWKISVMRLQAVKEMAVTLKMLVKQKLVQIDCGASVNILLLKYAGGEELIPCLQTLVMCKEKQKSSSSDFLLLVRARHLCLV